METAEFKEAFAELMCAEAWPWRCHRQLVADALAVRRRRVVHIMGPGRSEDHALNASARALPDGRLIYDGGAGQQAELFD